jgi:transposase
MEDILDVYTQSYDEGRVLVCMDETSKQQIMEVRQPVPAAPGQEGRYDAEYKRNGVSNVFMLFAPLAGWRHVEVTDRRTRRDWAQVVRQLVDAHFPQAKKIVLVMDNLNVHSPASLYEAFRPEEAKRIADRLEIHYTPKHGSWLNMAEIELSVLGRQCLSRRIPDQQTLRDEVAAWENRRNGDGASIDWRFTTQDARIKLKKLYPSFLV